MATIRGAKIMARALKQQGVDYMFGIVGFPVVPIAMAAQKEGITYIGMRNEQSASYAAQAAGYLTGRPQACLVVSGPGVIHALSGLANAKENCWPMILIGGASAVDQNGMGAFQEESQVAAAAQFCKYAHAVEDARRIPYYVEQAVRHSLYGRPGAAYLDMPDDIERPGAAALYFPFHLAWLGLFDRAALTAGESVLVHAAAGGSGSAAVQLAAHAGARVFATAGGPPTVLRMDIHTEFAGTRPSPRDMDRSSRCADFLPVEWGGWPGTAPGSWTLLRTR